MVSARKAHDQFPPGIETRHAHGGHDRFGAAHVKGDFVQLRHTFEHANVLRHYWMERTEHGHEIFDKIPALFDPSFIVVEAGHVDAIGATDIKRQLPIESSQLRTLRCRDHRTKIELFAHYTHERKRHAVGIGEAKVGKAFADCIGPCD